MMHTIKVIDFETNGLEPTDDALEFGWQDLHLDDRGWFFGKRDCYFLHSEQELNPEAQAVHHITAEMLKEAWPLERQWRRAHGWGKQEITAYAAHNIAMEQKYATAEMTGGKPWICTFKCAMRAWPDCPSFSNQVVRYWKGLHIPPQEIDVANNAHSAEGDAYVTAHILMALLQEHPVALLVQWTTEPKVYPRLTFGKHKGLAWPAVPHDYLDWIVYKSGAGQMDDWEDWKQAARRELARRTGRAA